MSIMNSYGDATVAVWEVDNNGEKISIPILNEPKQVIGNKFVLEGIPDEQYRVFINGLVEIDIKDKITNANQFKVDYRKNGVVFVHDSLDGQWLTVSSYSSKGLVYMPASRIWTKLSVDGKVTQTMDGAFDILDSQSDSIQALGTNIQALKGVRISEGITEPIDTKYWYDPNDNSRVVRT